MPSLQELATNLQNYQYYSGLGAFKQNKLPFGSDTVGGGNSGQPFIVRNIDQRWSPSNFSDAFSQFGTVTAVNRTAADVSRISQFLYNTPQGNQFLLKQTGLQRMNPNTEVDAYNPGKNTVATQVYNPLGINTLAQVGVNAAGLHYKKHGLLPGFSDNTKYEKYILDNDKKGNNRLNSLSVYLSNNTGIFRDYILKYKGGPDSFFGIGNTTISRYSYMLNTSNIEDRSATNSGFSYIPYAQYQSLNAQKEIEVDLNKGRATEDNIFKFGQNADFRKYKNKLNQAQFENKYNILPESNYEQYNLERRIGVPRVRTAQQRASYTTPADTADRINAISLYYANAPAVTTTDINGNPVNDENIPNSSIRDMVKFRIKILDNDRRTVANGTNYGVYIVFRAYVSNIKRNFTSKWDAYKYVGRGESFYAYDGFTESITYSFTIAASSRAEMKPLYQKLNYLISSMTPDYKDNLMRGNIAELTIGDFVLYQPGIITNFDMFIDEDTNWEIALDEPESGGDSDMHELPQMIKCNMTFVPIYNFLPRKSTEAPFLGLIDYDGKPAKEWLKGTNDKLK